MTQRQVFNLYARKQYILERDGYICRFPECNLPGISLAHRIAQTKANIKIYGRDTVNHDYNLVTVCSNPAHNDYFNIGNNPGKCTKLLSVIRQDRRMSTAELTAYINS